MLSIIIPVYNQTVELLERAVLSALAQFGVKKEILIVDDGSTDHCVENMFSKSNIIFPPDVQDFRIIHKKNGGVSSAFNKGIEESRGEYVSFLSSDDYFYPEKSYIQLLNMEESGAKFSFTGFRQLTLRCDKVIALTDYPSRYPTGLVPSETLHADLLQNFPSSFINGVSVIFHKDIIDKIGGFDPNIKYLHDYELWLRASKRFDAISCYDIFMVKHLHENQIQYMKEVGNFEEERKIDILTIKGMYL